MENHTPQSTEKEFHLFERVEKLLFQEAANDEDIKKLCQEMYSLLPSFKNHLMTHLEREQNQLSILDRCPHLEMRIKSFHEEHKNLKEIFCRLERNYNEKINASAWEEYQENLRCFLEMLKDHEIKENTVIQEVYYRDLGGEK